MLWERPGEACARGGRLACAGDLFGSKVDLAAWRRLGALVDAGMRGVREACPRCEIAIHTSLGNRIAEFSSVGIGDWYELLLNHTTSPSFDRIGLSLYPAYLAPHPSSRPASALENIDALASLARRFPGKRVYIAETAYPQRGTAPPPHRFAASPLGQYEYLRAVLSRLAQALPEAQRGGVLWWERNESCDDALFSPSGVASPALLHGFVHGRLPRHHLKAAEPSSSRARQTVCGSWPPPRRGPCKLGAERSTGSH
uniref:arabinogalactan endo-beta-1,4-galactanase n=2 Tax=Emiliania huxleyi TaxID=2903 RepID=A0A6U8JQW7_EMIHU